MIHRLEVPLVSRSVVLRLRGAVTLILWPLELLIGLDCPIIKGLWRFLLVLLLLVIPLLMLLVLVRVITSPLEAAAVRVDNLIRVIILVLWSGSPIIIILIIILILKTIDSASVNATIVLLGIHSFVFDVRQELVVFVSGVLPSLIRG